MVFSATSGFGVGWVGHRPPQGSPSRPGYPGSPGGRSASLFSSPCCSILSMYTRPTTTVCSSATLPFPLPLSTYRIRAVPLFFPPSPVVFLFFVTSSVTVCIPYLTTSSAAPAPWPVLRSRSAVPRCLVG